MVLSIQPPKKGSRTFHDPAKMNNRDVDDFAINSDAVLYNTSLTEMHSGGEDGMGETFGMKHGCLDGDGLSGDGAAISLFPYYFFTALNVCTISFGLCPHDAKYAL